MIAHAVQPDAQRDTDALEEEFFSTPPPAYVADIDGWIPAPMSASNRRAMKATLAMLACCALATVAFAAFSEHVFVFPAPLRAHAQLPAPVPAPTHEPPPATPAPELALAALALTQAPALAPALASAAALTPVPAPALAPASASAPAARRASPAAASTSPRATRRTPAAARSSASPADDLVKRADRELASGDAREAQQLANQAILIDPKHARAYIVLGGARDAVGDAAGTRAAFRACVQHAEGPLLSTCKTLAR